MCGFTKNMREVITSKLLDHQLSTKYCFSNFSILIYLIPKFYRLEKKIQEGKYQTIIHKNSDW